MSSAQVWFLRPLKIFITRPDVAGPLDCFVKQNRTSVVLVSLSMTDGGMGVKGLWKNHFSHAYPLQFSERATHWVSSARGRAQAATSSLQRKATKVV